MPTKRERDYYRRGFEDGQRSGARLGAFAADQPVTLAPEYGQMGPSPYAERVGRRSERIKPKRKLSAWNKYVKANSKKPRFRYRNGKLNLKKMAIAFRKTPAGRKKKRR